MVLSRHEVAEKHEHQRGTHEPGRNVTKAYEAANIGVGTDERSVAELSRASAVIGVGIVTGELCTTE